MKPRHLEPMPSHYFSPSYRGAPLTPSETGSQVYKSRKMEGTLGGIFNVLLAGERVSGTAIYGARKKLGFGAIDWIEQAEPGTSGYRRISPSEALGLRGYDDRFWTGRGITSFALDIVLDPTTYIGVGLVGKGAKVAGMVGRSIRVGEKGAQFISATQARGISRATAERKLIEYMGRSTSVQAEMMARTGPSAVKFMGQPIMETARVTEPAGAIWRAAPMYASRAAALENLRTKFIPFHKLTQQVGAAAVSPFKEFYRATGVRRTQWDRYVQRMSHDVPEEFGVPIARYLELGEMPTSNIDEILRLAKKQQSEYMRMHQEKVSVGLLKQEQFIPRYMPHVPTESAMSFAEAMSPKLAGRRREETAALYLRSVKSAKERLVTEDVFAANIYMRKKTGIEQWFETDPFVAFQKYGAEHIMGMESEYLRRRISTQMGFKAAAGTKAKYTKAEIDIQQRLLRGGIDIERIGYEARVAKLRPSLLRREIAAAEAERALSAYPSQFIPTTDVVTQMFPKTVIGRQLYKRGARLQQQEYALSSVRRFMESGGKVGQREFTNMLEDLKTAQIFGDVRPMGRTPWSWMKAQFEMPLSEYGSRIKSVRFQENVIREEGLAISSMYETMKVSSPRHVQSLLESMHQRRKHVAGARRSIASTQEGIDIISGGMRQRLAAVERELMEPAGKAIRKYRVAYESELEKTMYMPFGKMGVTEPFGFKKYAKGRSVLERRAARAESELYNIEQQIADIRFVQYKMEGGVLARKSALQKKLAATVGIPADKTLEQGGILYQLEKGHYIPTEAFAEYTRRIPTTGWGSRLETKFKKTLTSIWPAFHARNLYGMVGWQNVLAGAGFQGYKTNIDVLRKTSPWMMKHMPWAVGDVGKLFDVPFMGKKTAAEMRVISEEAEIYGITGMVDVAATYSVKRSGIMNKLGRFYEQVPQEAMVGVESVGRGALFWDRLMKGVPIESAMKDVEKFHFRYGSGALTEFETDYMRHGFLFYRWMRGNLPLQAQMSIEKPYMYAGLGKIQERAHTQESRAQMADWQKERFGFTVDNTFVSLDLPFYEHPALLAHPSNWEDLYFALTPAIKYPVGMFAGRDPGTGAPIESFGARTRFTMSQFMGRGVYAQRELAKTWSGERPVSWTALHQLGGLGVYELSPRAMQTGMTKMPGMPSDLRAMGITQEKWTEYKLATGWKPRLTDVSRAEIYQEKGGRCSVCGKNCSPMHPCRSQLIVPVEKGGTYTPENTILVCDECSGTYRRNISPLMRAQQENLVIPEEYRTIDRNKIYGVIESYMDEQQGMQSTSGYDMTTVERNMIYDVVDDYVSDANLAE